MSDADRPTLPPVGGTDAIGRMLGLLGDEWRVSCSCSEPWRVAGDTATFLQALPTVNAVLSARLATLTDADPFERIAYQHTPPRSENLLTT